jgi:putative endonuclease
MAHHARLGRHGEDVATAYLTELGWRVLARNWRPADRTLRGELDLVAADRSQLVVCEVKTRSGAGAGLPAEAVTRRKLAQLRRLAAAWLVEHPGAYRTVRFDVIGLLWPPSAIAPTIDHRRAVGD